MRVVELLDDWPVEALEPLLPWLDTALLCRPDGFPLGGLTERVAQWAVPVQPRYPTASWLQRLAAGESVPQARLTRTLTLEPFDWRGQPRWTQAQWRRILAAPELEGVAELTVPSTLRGPWLEIACSEARLGGVRVVFAERLFPRGGERADWLLQAPWMQRLDFLDLSESLDHSLAPLLDYPDLRIGHLMLEECWISDDAMRAMLHWPPLLHMRCLNVRMSGVHPREIREALETSPHLHADLTLLGLDIDFPLPCVAHPDLLPAWEKAT